jgi:hypothetical protein
MCAERRFDATTGATLTSKTGRDLPIRNAVTRRAASDRRSPSGPSEAVECGRVSLFDDEAEEASTSQAATRARIIGEEDLDEEAEAEGLDPADMIGNACANAAVTDAKDIEEEEVEAPIDFKMVSHVRGAVILATAPMQDLAVRPRINRLPFFSN